MIPDHPYQAAYDETADRVDRLGDRRSKHPDDAGLRAQWRTAIARRNHFARHIADDTTSNIFHQPMD